MESRFSLAPLEQIAELSGGFAFKSNDYTSSGRFVLRSLNILDDGNGTIDHSNAVYLPEKRDSEFSRFLLQAHDTLFVMVGASLGKIGYVRESDLPALLNQNMWLIRAKAGTDPRFLHYAFRIAAKSGLGWASGSARDFVRRSDYRALPIPLPPLKEQLAIAEVLSSFDDKIHSNKKICATLEALGRALFKSWFVDFDPVRAKVEGFDTGLSPEIAGMFPDSLEASEFGEIPTGWAVRAIGDIADIVGGSTPKTSELSYWDGPYAWATPKDLANLDFPVLLSTQRTITQAGLSTISSGLLPVGTILLSSRAPIGYLAVTDIPVAINQGFIAMKPRAETSKFFLLRWAHYAHDAIMARANGSTFLEISKTNFRPIPIIVPPSAIMQTFDATANSLYQRLVCAQRESHTLAALRDTLLPKLISGEIRVADAERMVERSA